MCNRKAFLLNASNMETFPVYPYAFIQVPAVARQWGVDVICKELLGIPQERWAQTVLALIEQHNPAMILITLRNTDSMISRQYERDGSQEGDRPAYFPIERTRALMAAIRSVSDLKIALGGFGFSLLADELMHYLRPDFGVFGGPDAFFAHFADIKAGQLEAVANLLYFQEDRLVSNSRLFYPPLAETEYTPQAIEAMMAFYAHFPAPGFKGAPVEIMRGCSHACLFCAEPHVAGKQVRYRDLSAVMADIEMLADHGIRQIYMISSELNPKGNAFVLQLADKIRSFNQRQPADRRVTWFGANYLLKFSLDEYEQLHRSGFTGGWFDITALDDENARAMRTPYRNGSLLGHLKTYAQSEETQFELLQAQNASQSAGVEGQNANNGTENAIKWTLFLGNPATTTKTIRKTLRVVNQEGLARRFNSCYVNPNIRVFDYENPNEATLAVTYSVTPDLARTAYRQLLPSFAYPPALLRGFGTEEEVAFLFAHIAETYLSKKYQETRDWHSFIRQKTTPTSIADWMAELSETRGVHLPEFFRPANNGKASATLQRLFSPDPQIEAERAGENLAKQVVDSILAMGLQAFPDLFGSLGLPSTMDELEGMTPYELATAIFNKWDTEKELFDTLTEQSKPVLSETMQDFTRFCIQVMLYRLNVLINPKYRKLFVSDGLAGRAHV